MVHEKSKKHLKRLYLYQKNELHVKDRTHWVNCEVCNVSVNSLQQLKIHQISDKHNKKLEVYRQNELHSNDYMYSILQKNVRFEHRYKRKTSNANKGSRKHVLICSFVIHSFSRLKSIN